MRILVVFLLILFSSFNIKAIEIAAIEHGGRYMVFDLNTLEITNVGDLRRFGFIYVNGAIPGSTYDSAIIVAEFFKEPKERSLNHSQLTLNRLTKLNQGNLRIPKEHTIDYDGQNYARWVANDPKKRIIAMSQKDRRTATIYDENLKQIQQHKFDSDHKIHNAAACTDKNGNIVMAGLTKTVTFLDNSKQTTIKDLLINKELKNYGILRISDGCYAFMTSRYKKGQPMTKRIINIINNKAQTAFSIYKRGEYALIDSGQLLLQQRLNAIPIPNTPGVQTTPTDNFILYNTQTGEIVKEFKIPNQNATLKKVVKTDKGYIAILGGPETIQFVSLETFTSLKTIKLPFKRFFVI